MQNQVQCQGPGVAGAHDVRAEKGIIFGVGGTPRVSPFTPVHAAKERGRDNACRGEHRDARRSASKSLDFSIVTT
jgi:hypothetical protein